MIQARKALDEAWRLRPGDARTANLILDIEKSVGGGDRNKMELWFDRAMKADGNLHAPASPSSTGSTRSGTARPRRWSRSARACRATNNWRAGITLLVGDAHLRFANRFTPAELTMYLGSPEVWSDIQSVYDEYLKHYPNDDVARSKYAAHRRRSGHFPEAHAQFQVLGDRLTTWREFPLFPARDPQADARPRRRGSSRPGRRGGNS